MSDLSAYISIGVLLDKANNKITVTDTGTYPAGVNITASVSITQPDGISVVGSFSDITSNGGSVSKELRYAKDGSLQNGQYKITYTAKATSYSDTVLIRTIPFYYKAPELNIEKKVDVFTPYVKVNDATSYNKVGWGTPTVVRAWTTDIDKAGSVIQRITSTSQLFDMVYSAYYYDAVYHVAFSTTVTWTHLTYTYLSVKDLLTTSFDIDVYTPPSVDEFIQDLTDLQKAINEGTYCGGGCGCKDNDAYDEAASYYETVMTKGLAQDSEGLETTIKLFLNIINCSGAEKRVHTGAIIQAYDFSGALVSGEVATVVVITSASYQVAAGTLVEKISISTPMPITVAVGSTVGGTDIIDYTNIDTSLVESIDKYYIEAGTIYFTGVQGSTEIKIYQRG